MRIGVDLGGTKIEAAALERDGRVLARHRVATPANDSAAILAAVRDLVTGMEAATGRRGTVGVGMPGALSPATGLVKDANSLCLTSRAFARDLPAALGRPVRFANYANCFALSESVDGAAAGAAIVFGVILGPGVGGGIVAHGRLLTGINALAGEWGHSPVPWPGDAERAGPPCYCGKRGCIESFLSGPGLAFDHRQATGETADAASIAERTASGDPGAEASLARYEDRLARSLATVMNLLDPDVIVLGGRVGPIPRPYDRVPRLWDKYLFSDHIATPPVTPPHDESSGARGAALLWGADDAP